MLKKIILIVISLFLALPVAASDAGSIVPVIWLFFQNEEIEWEEWNEKFKDISKIIQYDANYNEIGYFRPFASKIIQYDANYNEIGYFRPFASKIIQYDANYNEIGYFRLR